ncbi:hypothetical protein DC030_13150 [Enterococcus faecalis]|nr:hypothetical protein DC030_13150 [Enterococcus faecalis]
MSLYLYIVFGLIALFRVTVLLISKNNEKKLILLGGKEYGKLVSKLLAILHTLFYFCSFFEGIYKKVEDVSTKYKYTVKAVSVDGVYSEESNEITVSTKVPVIPNPGVGREFKLGSITNPELYEKGEIVSYEGTNYISLVTHYNYGDASWNPKEAHSLFKAC